MHKTWLVGMLVMVMVAPGGLAETEAEVPLPSCRFHGPNHEPQVLLEDVMVCIAKASSEFCIWGEPWRLGTTTLLGEAIVLVNNVWAERHTLPARYWSDPDHGEWLLLMGIAGMGGSCQKHAPIDAVFAWDSESRVDQEAFVEWLISEP